MNKEVKYQKSNSEVFSYTHTYSEQFCKFLISSEVAERKGNGHNKRKVYNSLQMA